MRTAERRHRGRAKRLFHVDLLGDLDRPHGGLRRQGSSYHRVERRISRRVQDDHRVSEIRFPPLVHALPRVRSRERRQLVERELQGAPIPVLRHAVLRIAALEGVSRSAAPCRLAGGRRPRTRWSPARGAIISTPSLSPFESLRTIVRQWKRADAHRKQTGSMAEVISFQTGRLALPYKPEAAQGVTPEALRTSCREDYDPATVPAGAGVLIGAVDVQDNRLEAEVSAWGLVEVTRDDASQLKGWGSHEFRGLQHAGRWYRLRRWALEYHRFHGDPGTPELWEQLAEFMERPRPHATGPLLRPVAVGIDTGGHYGPQVADFCKVRGRGYQPLKGLPPQRYGAVLARRSVTADSLESYGPEGLMLVCGNAGKASCFSLMRQSIAGAEPRPMVWPMDETRYGPEEFEGIVSETLMRTLDKRTGATRLMWRKIARANEPLDVLVYSLALVSHLGLGFMLAEADAIAIAAGRKEAA